MRLTLLVLVAMGTSCQLSFPTERTGSVSRAVREVEDERAPDDVATTAAEPVAEDAAEPATEDGDALEAGTSGFARPDPERDVGYTLRSLEDSTWGLRLRFPFAIGINDFDSDLSLDQLTTVSFVPLLEAPVALDERWTVLPYVGLGAAYQNGDEDLVGENRYLGLFRSGVRAHRWSPFGKRNAWLAKGEVRYDAALTPRNGVLGDWGSADVALELRTVLGSTAPGPRLQPGIYGQFIHYWQAVELEIDGVSPEFVDDQVEFGISIGTHEPYKFAWFHLSRVYIGMRVGEELRGLRIRFGRL